MTVIQTIVDYIGNATVGPRSFSVEGDREGAEVQLECLIITTRVVSGDKSVVNVQNTAHLCHVDRMTV